MTGYRWSSGQVLTANDLDQEFDNVIALYNNLSNVIGTIQATGSVGGPVGITVNWSGQSVVTAGTYIVELFAPYQLTISSMNFAVGSAGGSFIATVRNAGVSITGISPQVISSATINTTVATANNIVLTGSTLDIVISSVIGNPSGAVIQLNGTRASNLINALPVASTVTLGGVIVGGGLQVTGAGVLSATLGAYQLPAATSSTLGGIIAGPNTTMTGSTLSIPFASPTQYGVMEPGRGLDTLDGTGLVGVTYGTTANTACQGNDSRLSGTLSLNSPAFTGIPTAPTAAQNTNTSQLATTAFVIAQGGLSTLPVATSTVLGGVKPDGVSIINNLGAISVQYGTTANTAAQGNDTRIVGAAPLLSPQFAGTPLLTTTPPQNSNGLQVASTLYVDRAVTASVAGVSSVAGQTGAVTLANLITGGVAPLASPALTGVPTAPTATGGTNTTQIATTQFVTSAVALSTTGVSQVLGNTGAVTLAQLVAGGVAPLANPTFTGVVTIPTGASITGYATLASPTFTGVPLAPTATTGTATAQLATTQFVASAVAASTTGVSQVLGNTGAITLAQLVAGGVAQLSTNTFTGAQTFNTTTLHTGVATFTAIPVLPAGIVNYAPLASPNFTGTAILTTPPTTNAIPAAIASTGYVQASISAVTSGITSVAGSTGTGGAISLAQLVAGGVAQLSTNTFTGAQTFNTTTLHTGVATFTAVPILPAGVTLSNATLSGTPTVAGYLTSALAASTYAPLANPVLTGAINMTGGTPTAPTASLGTSTTQVATTAFVQAALLNDVVGTVLAGDGVAGVYHADAAGNMSIDNVYPFAPITAQLPAQGSLWVWVAPRAVTISAVFMAANSLTGVGNGYTVTFILNGVNVPGLIAIPITSATGFGTYTPTTPMSVPAGIAVVFQVTVNGTPVAPTNIWVQYVGTYA